MILIKETDKQTLKSIKKLKKISFQHLLFRLNTITLYKGKLMSKAIVVLAPGFEEIEASTIIDILRRGEIIVDVASIINQEVKGAHELKFIADRQIESKSSIVDDTKKTDDDPGELKEFYRGIIKSRFQSNDDCDCNSSLWRPNLICLIMDIIIFPLFLFVFWVLQPNNLTLLFDLFMIPLWIWLDIYSLLGCD